MTLSQLAFPGEKQPEFLMGEMNRRMDRDVFCKDEESLLRRVSHQGLISLFGRFVSHSHSVFTDTFFSFFLFMIYVQLFTVTMWVILQNPCTQALMESVDVHCLEICCANFAHRHKWKVLMLVKCFCILCKEDLVMHACAGMCQF